MRRVLSVAGERVRHLARDSGGVVAPLVGLSMVVLVGFAGVATDLGVVFHEKRRLQAAADIAALAAVRGRDPAQAVNAALADNGYPAPMKLVIAMGTYAPDRALAPQDRFKPSAAAVNAARVSLRSSVKAGMSRVVGGPETYELAAVSTASRADLAAFGVGSRLAEIDGGVANAILSALLGVKVGLNALDYRSLADVRIDALSFLRNAGIRGQLKALTYDDILSGTIPAAKAIAALGDAAREAGAGSAVLATLAAAAGGANASRDIALGKLLSLGQASSIPVNGGGEAVKVNLASLLSGVATLANGSSQVALDLVSAPLGLARVRVTLRIGEGWRSSGLVLPGATLSTAQMRLYLEAWIPAPLGLAEIRFPVYVELGQASATLGSVTCPWTSRGERSASLDVRTGAVRLAIADVAPASLDPTAPSPPPKAATLIQLPLVSVTGLASSQVGSSRQAVSFSDADIDAGRVRTVSSGFGSPARSLLSTVNLELNGIPLGLPGLRQVVAGALDLAAPAVDTVLMATLAAVGVRIGAADVSVDATRCDGGVLVQ